MKVDFSFDFSKYDVGGMNAIAGDGKLTGDEVKKAKKDGWNVFEGYTAENGQPKHTLNKQDSTRLDLVVENAITNAQKDEDGSISRADAKKLVIEIFEQHNGTMSNKASHKEAERRDHQNHKTPFVSDTSYPSSVGYGFGYGYGYGYGGFLSQVKDLFELCWDEELEGGTKITPNEQQTIIETVKNWYDQLSDSKKK